MKFTVVDVQPNTGAQNLVLKNEDGAEQFTITVKQDSDLYGKYSTGDTFTLTGKHKNQDQEEDKTDPVREELEARNNIGDAERNASDPHQVDFNPPEDKKVVEKEAADIAGKKSSEKKADVTEFNAQKKPVKK